MEKKEKSILDYETVSLDLEHHALVIIDQTQLPGKIEMLSLTDIKDIWEAIRLLKVRGAPAIGVAESTLRRRRSIQRIPRSFTANFSRRKSISQPPARRRSTCSGRWTGWKTWFGRI